MSKIAERFRNATQNDVIENPAAFGAPTFEEFKRNREKYVGRDDDVLAQVDKGGELVRKFAQRFIYEIEGYRCKTLEEVERVASSQGIPLRELDYRPHVIPQGAGKWDAVIRFVPKSSTGRRTNARIKGIG